jgi:hypothetical protein
VQTLSVIRFPVASARGPIGALIQFIKIERPSRKRGSLDAASLSPRRDPHLARAVAAWLYHGHTEASLREFPQWPEISEPIARAQPDAPARSGTQAAMASRRQKQLG